MTARSRMPGFGLLAAMLGAAVSAPILLDAVGEGWGVMVGFAALAAGLTAMALWWLLCERAGRFGAGRGALAGGLAGLLSHYPCWYFAILGQNVDYWLLGGTGSSLGEAPIDPLLGLGGAAVLTFGSLLVVGWLTVPVGAAAGALYGWHAGRKR